MPPLDSGSESDSGSGSESEAGSPAHSATHSRNASPAKSSQSNGSNRSRSNSPHSQRTRSSSGHSRHSRSDSGSPDSRKSANSRTSKSNKSIEKSTRRAGSQSDNENSPKSGSQTSKSPNTSVKSRSQSPKSRSQSPKSRSQSPKSRSQSPKSRSQSPRSRSPSQGSEHSRKSKSQSPRSHKSASRSPHNDIAQDSRSNTPDLQIDDARRSRSRSRSSRGSSKSGSIKVGSKKRAVLSDSDASENENKETKEKRKHSITSDGDSGSDRNGQRPSKKKQKALIDSDSDNEDKDAEKSDNVVTADALFGDASDISSEDENKTAEDADKQESPKRRDADSDSERGSDREDARRSGSEERRSGDEGETNEPEVEPPVETRIDADIPKITTDLGKEIHFIKLPNFLSVETRPFDQDTYEDEIDEEETLDEEGRARLKLKVENTMRWRTDFDRNGDVIKESNARFVKWSDGSMSLHLGSEIFDVYKQPLHGDFNHLFVRQGSGLLGQAVFRTKLTFRPHSTESFTHRKMTLSLADRSQKTSGIKILSQVGVDPDQDRQYQLKKEEQELRASMRSKGSGGRISTGRRNARSDTSNRRTAGDDGSDDEGAISLQAIKNKYKSGQQHKPAGGQIYSSDEEASDVEARRAKRLDRAKVLQDSEDERDSRSEEENKRNSRSRSGSRSPAASHHSGSDSEE